MVMKMITRNHIKEWQLQWWVGDDDEYYETPSITGCDDHRWYSWTSLPHKRAPELGTLSQTVSTPPPKLGAQFLNLKFVIEVSKKKTESGHCELLKENLKENLEKHVKISWDYELFLAIFYVMEGESQGGKY